MLTALLVLLIPLGVGLLVGAVGAALQVYIDREVRAARRDAMNAMLGHSHTSTPTVPQQERA